MKNLLKIICGLLLVLLFMNVLSAVVRDCDTPCQNRGYPEGHAIPIKAWSVWAAGNLQCVCTPAPVFIPYK
jgi:hypothetical protein